MTEEKNDNEWPRELGDPSQLPSEMRPPRGLEKKVRQALLQRGLIHAGRDRPSRRAPASTWAFRFGVGLAASTLLFVAGYLTGSRPEPAGTTVAVAEQKKYALLLYEGPGYDRAEGDELLARYQEYNLWVAEARGRSQFVTGEDFSVENGWRLEPGDEDVTHRRANTASGAFPLSGIFVITASSELEALALAELLPHVRHGGEVVVQPVVPTEQPPDVGPAS